MVLISLIGEEQAHVGNRFYFMGPQTDCKECKLKGVCFNLEPGHQYEVISVRDTVHDCLLSGSTVRAVEVQKIPTRAVIGKRFAIEGSIITFEGSDCARLGCENYKECHPVGLNGGEKKTVEEVISEIECPIMGDRMLVKLD